MPALSILLIVFLVSLIIVMILLLRAKPGYEDEDGFHFGDTPPELLDGSRQPEPVERLISFPRAVMVLAALGAVLLAAVILADLA